MLICGDARMIPLADKSVNCCVTSPPYWGLRDYGVPGQIGLERTPEEYVAAMLEVFREVRRVLRDDGTLWLNMGDSYAGSAQGWGHDGQYSGPKQSTNRGSLNQPKRIDDTVGFERPTNYISSRQPNGLKPKDLVGIPWMLAFALRTDGWYLRSDIIWSKPNPMPESVTDRPTKAHEYIFLLSKSGRYYYDQEAILEPASENTHMRLSQNLALQIGSHRANGGGKTNGPMKAVGRKAAGTPRNDGDRWNGNNGRGFRSKQDETGNRRYTGFNERWKVKHNASFDASVCLPVTERNKRTVWTVNAQGFAEAHFATFPEDLIKPCILAGCPAGGTVLDPFAGSGTTLLVARNLQCKGIGLELNPAYIEIAKRRLSQEVMEFVL